ncbi:trichohyalin isoform X1 [Sebastes umbrosus]|uniref:trichohyalin isoform X1 n=1 Tax=Sebastes umbrosus TaxID=72105 RepID=UPI0018A0BF64|nr:trichohyalin isoform X1 [Sebastes umbrosus]
MDTKDENCSPVIVTNGDYPVRCTEEVLLPFFIDESLQAAMDSQQPPASHSLPPALPEIRLVLLGRKGAGKSAAGNTILGAAGGFESGKPTEECVKRRADVAGRKVTVVDTPGWEWYYPLNSTPNWVRRETLRSVSLCPSGPHAVLLVMRSCASVTEDYIIEIEEHLEPLGKGVWERTMLLFTRGDELGLVSMEQRILTSGPALQRLLQKCGNRYHVVDNRSKGDGTQVKELIRKLEEMVALKKDGSSHLEMDNTVLVGLEADGKRRARERRKKQRQMEAQVQRGTIKAALMSDGLQGSELDAHQSFSKAPRRLPEVRLVLLGERETGKSSAGNTILGKTEFFQAGAVTEECTRQQAEVAMRLVTVVDTPGWEGGVAGATPERVKREIVSSVALCPPGPHALLLTLRVDTLVRAAHVREHLELLGEGIWRHTILLFTHGDQLREGVDIEQHIQGGGRDLQGLLETCRGRYHVISSVDGGGRGNGGSSTVTELLKVVEKMTAMNRCEAFSGLVQEVRDLSRHKNEKFNQRLKDMGDKMLRQEDELKKMREREMKRIRWFFDRKKKPKSPGKADVQREEEEEEEEEDRRMDERRNDIGELEDKMRWLTEDKEREIQDLSVANERIRVALNQSRGERDEATLNLELKEREIEELRERIDEQQVKLLDLECAGVEIEHERKQREDTIRAKKQEWMSEVRKLEENIELQRKEKTEWMEKVDSLKAEMDKAKRHHDDVLERKEQEKNREMAQVEEQLKKEMEIKEKEQEELRKKVSEEKQIALDDVKQYEKDMETKVEEMKSEHKKEMERKMHEKDTEMLKHQDEMTRKISELEKMMETMNVQHQKEMNQKLKDNAEDIERVKQQHDNEIKDARQEKQRQVAELKEQFAKETEEQMQAKKTEITELEQRYVVQNEKEKEMIHLNHKKDMTEQMQDKEKEVEVLKLQHQEEMARKMNEMEKLMQTRGAEHKEETDRKVKEKEEDVEKVQQQCRDQIRDMEQERQREVKELKQQFAGEIEKQLQERQREIRELEQKHAAQTKEKVLENEKEMEVMNGNREKYILQQMHERDGLIEELKRQHINEIKEKMQESEQEKERIVLIVKKEMEQRLEEKEEEMEEIKLSVREMKEELQQKEEKEIDHLNYKREMQQNLEDREKGIEEMKLKVKDTNEKLQRKEEKEIDHLNYKKEIEQRLEDRERETETIKEHLEELEQQLRQTGEERERDCLNHKKQMEQKLQEKERMIEKLNQHIKDVDEILQRKEEERGEIILNQKKEAEQRLQDREREMEEMKLQLLNDTERKVKEKESEIESVKQQADSREARWKEEQRKKDERGGNESNRLLEIIDEKTKEITQAQCLLAERNSELDEAKKTCANYLKEIEELKESINNQTASITEIQQRHTEQEMKKDTEMMEKLQEKEEELRENEKEIIQLRLTIEQTKSELKELISRMEKEMTSMIREYEKEIARRNESVESAAKERDGAVSRWEEVAEKYEESRRRAEELQEQNEKLRKETDNLKIKCEELRTESEEEVREQLRVKSIEAEIRGLLKERDVEVEGLKEANYKVQEEIERIQKGKESEKVRDEEFLKEVGEREQVTSRNEEELSKRGHELGAKEEELAEKEVKLDGKEEELSKWEASLEKQQKEQEGKEQDVEKKERELESLLRALEGKQKELNCHGQDLQEKVKGLKDHGKELKDRECYLRNEEQELLGWKSELQMQNEHVNSTTQQLDEMGRDLALLKEELHNKEKNLKASLKKMGKWEQNLTEREEGLHKKEKGQYEVDERDSFDLTDAVESSGDDLHVMYREVSERREKGRGRESDSGDQRMKTASSAADNCHLETLKEIKTDEEKEEGEETSKDLESAKVIGDVAFLSASHRSSNNKELPGSDLRVVVLGESWSPCSPAGVTILCGEAFKSNGSTFRPWRGQVAGRRLAVAEPLGLKWRDGPDPTQRRSILDSVSWCRPGPHVVLLLMPAFLSCTQKYRRAAEEHMSLIGGEDVWQRTLVLFTWGEMLGESAEQHILRNGELTGLVERCGGRYHVLSSKRSNSLIEGLFEKMEDIAALNSREL